MLIRFIYVITSNESADINEFKHILQQAQTNNQRRDLTDMLAFNSKIFLQALEGDREEVNALYAILMRDTRHSKLAVLKFEEIEERHWASWSMGFAAPNADNRALFLKHSTQSSFNPYAMSANAVEKMLKDLSSTVIAMSPTQAAPAPAAFTALQPDHASISFSAPQPTRQPASMPTAGKEGIFSRFLKK